MPHPEFIYVDRALVPYPEARIHVSSVAAKYGANVFEGLAAYAGDHGHSFVFRVADHVRRLHESVRLMQIDCAFRDEDFTAAILTALRANHIRGDAHIRLTIFITGDGYSDVRGPASLVCSAQPRAATALDERTVRTATSTWRRIDDMIMPPRLKAGANYHNSRFGLLEARRNGYDEAVFLSLAGKVAEGANACFAMVRGGVLVTPPPTAGVLESVTSATLRTLAGEELGLDVHERDIDRSELYVAEEAFFCGSGAEIRPVLSVDRLPVGDGRIGPITRRLWDAYEAAVRGRDRKRTGWLTSI